MAEILDSLRIIAPYFLGSWLLFFFSVWRKPQRLRNSLLLMFALFFTLFFLTAFFGAYKAYAMLGGFVILMLALMLVPVMLIHNGVVMIRRESAGLPNVLSLILGIFIFVGEVSVIAAVFSDPQFFGSFTGYYLIGFVGISVFYVSCFILCFVLYMLFIQFMPHRMNFQYVVIHGCGLLDGGRISKLLSNRVDKAIEIYEKCKVKPILIPSGGKGEDEDISEAEAMKRYLLAQGIPEAHILMEDRSATTMENLMNSKTMIEAGGGQQKTALVTSNYHVYRCLYYANKLHWNCVGFGAKVAWYYWPCAVLREFAAIFTKKPHRRWFLIGYLLFVVLPMGVAFLVNGA